MAIFLIVLVIVVSMIVAYAGSNILVTIFGVSLAVVLIYGLTQIRKTRDGLEKIFSLIPLLTAVVINVAFWLTYTITHKPEFYINFWHGMWRH